MTTQQQPKVRCTRCGDDLLLSDTSHHPCTKNVFSDAEKGAFQRRVLKPESTQQQDEELVKLNIEPVAIADTGILNWIDGKYFRHSQDLYAAEDVAATITRLMEELQALKTVPMKYRRMEFNAKLQEENAALRQQLNEALLANGVMREALESLMEYAGIIEDRCDSVATDKARAALATPSPTALAERDAEVRRKALEAAAERVTIDLKYGPVVRYGVRDWLRSMAAEKGDV